MKRSVWVLVTWCCYAWSVSLSVNASVAEIEGSTPVPSHSALRDIRGQLRPRRYAVISAGLSATLVEFSIQRGDTVNQNDVVARFKCSAEEAEHRIGEARVDASKAKVRVNERLSKLKNISSLEFDVSKAELLIAEAELERIAAQLSECQIRAPFGGIITEKHVQSHQYVTKGDALFELVDTGSLEIEMIVPSKWINTYPKGSKFRMLIDETNSVVSAEIDRIVGVIDPVSQTARMVGKLINPPDDLLPGMSGIIEFSEH